MLTTAFQVTTPSTEHGQLPRCTGCQRRQYARSSAQNFYDVLSISPKATQSQVKSAYYVLSKKYHPDMNQTVEGQRVFAEIAEAYEVLGNVSKRRQYDRGIVPSNYGPVGHATPAETYGFDKFKRQAYKAKQGEYQMGKTDIYNFDEFYRQHYGDTIGKMKEAKAAADKQHIKDLDERRRSWTNMFCIIVIGALFVVFTKDKHQ